MSPYYGRRAWAMTGGAHGKRRGRPHCRHKWITTFGIDMRPVVVCRHCMRIKRGNNSDKTG